MSALPRVDEGHGWRIRLNRGVYWLSRHRLLSINVLIGIWVGLPWLAPLFMELGWIGPAKAIYLLYAVQCHQLPQRSFFLFGANPMYSLAEVQAAWQSTNDPIILRRFMGGPALGWKVAWSDRMVYMYTSILFWSVLFWPVRKRLKSLPWWGLVLLLLPMAVDGLTHMISDFAAGIGLGFRDSNAWLAALTNDVFPVTFYAGDALGSFNSWMRMMTGLLFSLGLVWVFYPSLQGGGFSGPAARISSESQTTGTSK